MKKFRLEDIEKKQPFKVPNGYFDQLNTSILSNIDRDKSDKNVTQKQTFTVPSNYFEELNASILSKVDPDLAHQTSTKTRNNLWYWVAAAVFVLVSSVSLMLTLQIENQDTNLLADISDEEIWMYLDYYQVEELDLIESISNDMDWVSDEEQLLDDMLIDTEDMDNLYLEYGIEEIIES